MRWLRNGQRGSILVLTLWTVVLLGVLVTALASETRLAARVVQAQQEDVATWAALVSALHQAEMELMLETMPLPPDAFETPEDMARTPRYRFNGEALQLHYPQAEDIVVRIEDHSGKINLRALEAEQMRALLQKRLGLRATQRDDRVESLIAAWVDWQDLNDQAISIGAERDYYLGLDPPYEPRNGRIESVAELLLIRGFAEVFAGVDLEAAFTLYGEDARINLNVATFEALQLLPGLDDETIAAILEWRQENEFRGNGDVVRLLDAPVMAQLRPWLDNRKQGNHFTILAHARPTRAGASTYSAWAETVEVRGPMERPRVLRVDPYRPLSLRFRESPVE